MITESQRRVQNAFITAIVADGIASAFLIVYCYFSWFTSLSIPSNFITVLLIIGGCIVGPIVVGSVALSMLKGVNRAEIVGKYRAYYIIARVLSLVCIIACAIIGTCFLFTGLLGASLLL